MLFISLRYIINHIYLENYNYNKFGYWELVLYYTYVINFDIIKLYLSYLIILIYMFRLTF